MGYLSGLFDDSTKLVIQFLMLRIQSEFISVGRDIVGPQHEIRGAPPHHTSCHHEVLLLTLVTEEMPAAVLEGVVSHTIAASHPHHAAVGRRTHVLQGKGSQITHVLQGQSHNTHTTRQG